MVIHKPAGLLVHRSRISQDREFILQRLRNQIGMHVFPVHRLDRATAGVLAFGLNADAARRLTSEFEQHQVCKRYLAVARGWVDTEGLIDHPVADEDGNGVAMPATTHYATLARAEFAEAVDRYPSSRYSLLCIEPITGRRQQIRKHFKHISHPLIGDTTHGNGRHNRFFRERFKLHRLLLLAFLLRFTHPYSGEAVEVHAQIDADWRRVLSLFGVAERELAGCRAATTHVTHWQPDDAGDDWDLLAQ